MENTVGKYSSPKPMIMILLNNEFMNSTIYTYYEANFSYSAYSEVLTYSSKDCENHIGLMKML